MYCDEIGGKAVVTAINSSQLSNDSDDKSIQFVIVTGNTLMRLYCLVEY